MSRKNQTRDSRGGNVSQNNSRSRITPTLKEEDEMPPESDQPVRQQESHTPQGVHVPNYALVIAQHPVLSVAAGFGVGLGLGVLLTAVLTGHEKNWFERHHIPESLHDFTTGLRGIPDRIARHIPDSFTRR